MIDFRCFQNGTVARVIKQSRPGSPILHIRRQAQGIPETPVENVWIENVTARTNKLMLLQDVDGMVLKNVTVECPDSLIRIVDGRHITFDQVHFILPDGKVRTEQEGELAREPEFIRCLIRDIER